MTGSSVRARSESIASWVFLHLSDLSGFLRAKRLAWVFLVWAANMEEYHGGPSPRHLRPWREVWKDACDLEGRR